MLAELKLPKEFCNQCIAELVTGIHIKPVIKTIGVITFVNGIDGMPVKKKILPRTFNLEVK